MAALLFVLMLYIGHWIWSLVQRRLRERQEEARRIYDEHVIHAAWPLRVVDKEYVEMTPEQERRLNDWLGEQ